MGTGGGFLGTIGGAKEELDEDDHYNDLLRGEKRWT